MTFKILLFKKKKFSSILIFSVYCFVSMALSFPPPSSLFPHFVIGFSGPAVPQELSVWEHVCTNMVLIRMPLLPLGPLTVGLLFFFFPLKLALTSCFCCYSWCRTRSHLFFCFCSVGGRLINKNISFAPEDFISSDNSISVSVLLDLILALSFSDYSAVVFRFSSIKSAVTLNDTWQLHLTVAL